MKTDRRSFLKLFGVSTAAVATAEGVEVVSSPDAPAQFEWDAHRPLFRHGTLFDVRPQSLYHRIDIPKNSMQACYQGFSTFRGMDNDLTITNMVRANCLPEPNSFQVQKFGIVFSPKTEPALRSAFLDRYMVRFAIAQKTYFEGPLSFIFSTVGEPDREKGFTTLPDIGLADISAVPLIISDEVTFRAEIIGTPIQTHGKLIFWIVLQGIMARAVQ